MLLQFIGHFYWSLSLACKGQNIQLDNKLTKPFHTIWEYIPKVKQIIGFYAPSYRCSLTPLKNSLRDTEFVAYYGSEQFVLLLPDCSNSDIIQLLNSVRNKVKNISFKFKKSDNYSYSIYRGCAGYGD